MGSTAEGSGSINVTPVANRISPFHLFGADTTTKAVKRTSTIVVEDRGNDCDCSSHVCWCDRIGQKRQKFIPRVGSHPDIFSCDNLIKGLNLNKYGSMTKDIEALIAERKSYMMSNHESTPTNSSKVLNVEKNPGDLRPENSALLDIITDEDEDLSSQKISSAPPDTGTRKAIDEMLTENVDLDCAQDQCLRKENVCSPRNTEVQKEQGIYLGVEAKDEMEDTSEQNGVNYDSLSKNIEVNQDSGVNLGVKGDNGMEEGNALTVLSCEDLAKISETNEVMDLGLKAEGGMEEGKGKTSANSGGLPKVSKVNMDRVVDLAIGVESGMKKGNRHARSNYEHLAKIPEIDTCNANIGLEARYVVEEDNGQTGYDCEGLAKISESNKDKDVCVGFKDDEEVEVENGQLDSCFDGLSKISKINEDKGVYVGMEDDDQVEEDNGQLEAGCYDIANIWNEMAVALECSKDTAVDSLNEQHAIEDAERCDHSFILKEDIGYVCRICGFVQRAIETIIEFQYAKAKRTGRTYRYEGSSGKDLEQTKVLSGAKLPDHDYSACELAIHPRHRKLMKPHQVEGFNFLLTNLVTDNPGGCIMAHAPGSGKTFMVISFLQSFMAKYPAARPLIVLPRGILSTWKKEFRRWQVEDIPLYDFYSSKADIRSQQLQILQCWVSERSILFLGYKQFSSIVCDSDTSNIASECEEILLTSPSILILDEGHTPRNQDTDILKSLEKVRTPRKVVLSGTLYQNHVEEVFNILNLVRPRFLKLDGSKMIKRRILSRVQIAGRKRSLKRFSNDDFYDAVERTLLKDESFSRKVAVIQDLREMTSKVLHYYKGDSLDELPGLVDFTIFLELSPKQKGEVTELKKMKNRFKRNSYGSNIYVHPLLKTLSDSGMKERVDDHKIDLILEKLDEREGVKAKFYLNLLHLCESSGEKLLVFSQYLLPLKFLERLTVNAMGYSLGKEIFMITGDSDSDLRDSYMELFNNSSAARVLFGSIKACGEGISLVGASRIIVLDVHLNPSVTRQAIGRAFRPGQVRKVYTYRLVASDSPEVDDHLTCFRKETISKMWFEWNGCLGEHDFEMERVNVEDSGDLFLETPGLSDDVISVFKR